MSDREETTEELPLEPNLENLSLRDFRGGNQLPVWDLIGQDFKMPKKHSLGPLLFQNWKLKDSTDLVLKLGTKQICVNRTLFMCYSKYAMAQLEGGQRELVLPEDRVPPEGLVRTCEWMTQPVAKLDHQYIVHILATAIFLEIEPLIKQIWFCLDMDEFTEDKAFAVFYDAYQLGHMFPVMGLDTNMLSRIKRFFLTFVASAEFVEMQVHHVRCLLASDNLAVNTEKEVFYAAVRWINYDWKARFHHVLNVMESVRLILLPLKFLISLQSPSKDPALNYIISHQKFREMAYDAYIARILMILNDGSMLFDQLYNIFEIQVPLRRPFIYDGLCPYHRARPTDEEVDMNYVEFEHYLTLLQMCGPTNWRAIQVEDKSINNFNTENARNELRFINEEEEELEEEPELEEELVEELEME